jgi:uncharacterized membrane protein YeaQ/YmgE (transglycosylase-associated protein family)
MEQLSGTLIYWYISVGLIVGLVNGLVIGKEGVSFFANLGFGVLGAVIMGIIGLLFGIGDGVFFSFIATWPFLFLVNVFHHHHREELLEDLRDAKPFYKKKQAEH